MTIKSKVTVIRCAITKVENKMINLTSDRDSISKESIESCIDDAIGIKTRMSEINEEFEKTFAEMHEDSVISEYTKIEEYNQTILRTIKLGERILNQISSQHKIHANSLKLPKIKLAAFDGDIQNWCSFWDSYNEGIHKSNLSEVEKMTYLVSLVTGKAKNCIAGLAISADNYQEAISLLGARYDKRDQIIRCHMANLLDIKELKNTTSESIFEFIDKIQVNVRAMRALNVSENHYELLLVQMIESKIPSSFRSDWTMDKGFNENKLNDIIKFLTFKAESAEFSNYHKDTIDNHSYKKSIKAYTSVCTTSNQALVCYYCKNSHRINKCHDFNLLTIKQRRDFVSKNSLCFNCLGKNHDVTTCRSNNRCLVNRCGALHHTLLHESQQSTHSHAIFGNHCLLQILPIRISNHEKGLDTNSHALIDSGSQSSFLSSKIAKYLQLPLSQTENISMSTLSGSKIHSIRRTSLNVGNLINNMSLQMCNVIVIDKLNINLTKPFDLDCHEHLQDISFPKIESDSVDMIIGCDNPEILTSLEYRRDSKSNLVGMKTILGWTIFGNDSKNNLALTTSMANSFHDEYLRLLINNETFGELNSGKMMSIADKQILNILEKSTSTDKDNHYVIPMLWNDNKYQLSNNMSIAEKRLNSSRKRFENDTKLFERYNQEICNLIVNNFARKISKNSMTTSKWYLPHHNVTNPKKPNKFRIVFDAAAVYNGYSLNDCLSKGPDLTNELISVLCRFRQESIAITADIEAMYHQVKATDDDSRYLRFLWWTDKNMTDIDHFEFLVHIFGSKCSATVANYALSRAATDNINHYPPSVIKSINTSFYVDDYLESFPTEKEAYNTLTQISELLKSRGFNLRKWNSNNDNILNQLNLPFTNERKIQVLGLTWYCPTDTFGFDITPKLYPNTKRGILSLSASIFDPLGMLAPILLIPKLILRNLWKLGYDWDDPISYNLELQWKKWLNSLCLIESFRIPRCLKVNGNVISIQMHSFSDASENAMGVCTYIRTMNDNGDINLSLVFGKTKVSPTKFVTIPRLELIAATMSANITSKLVNEMNYKFDEIFLWTDSTATLAAIQNHSIKMPTFVINRITMILSKTNGFTWRHVPGKLNPADEASRGTTTDSFMKGNKYWNGPEFLLLDPQLWPDNSSNYKVLSTDIKATNVVNDHKGFEYLLNYFSNYDKLLKSIAWLTRFAKYLKDKTIMSPDYITFSELAEAEICVVKYCQRQHFSNDICKLSNFKSIPRSSPLCSLAPFIDNKGILRVGGRLINREGTTFDNSHQIILPKREYISRIILRQYHVKWMHSGREATLAVSRQKFWVLGSRSIIKNIISKCITCRKMYTAPSTQYMGNLPAPRLTSHVPPFSVCGVDLFGPFQVRVLRSTVKRWGVIFVCFSTKAIHIEICPTLEANDFINTLVRFSSRRGNVSEIWSDNGTNFKLTNKLLYESMQKWINSGLPKKAASYGIAWKFIPPGAPHMGGLWERAVKSVKTCLNIDNHKVYDDYTLATYLSVIENILNDRPLTAISEDPLDIEALTPNHFLMARKSSCAAIENDVPPNCKKRWRDVQYMANQFWRRWLKYYIPTLQKRNKWHKASRNISRDDLVLVVQDNTRRGDWPLGRILNTHEGTDGFIRVVDIKTKNGVFRRPITKICLLEERD